MLRTYDGERVMVPCAQVRSNPITNHTALGRRRTTLSVGVSYGADLRRAIDVVLDAVREVDGVLPRPAPEVRVEELGESGVALAMRFWHAPDIATLWRRSDVAVAAKRALDDAGIEIPFPRRVLRFASDRPSDWGNEDARSSSHED